jgi:type II secretory pathway pseudopilin PulG
MDEIRTQMKNPLVTCILGFIIGLIIGLPVLGWWLWPVEWTNATPQQLREDLKIDYLKMAIDSYQLNIKSPQAMVDAKDRWDGLGKDAGSVLDEIRSEDDKKYLKTLEPYAKIVQPPSNPDNLKEETKPVQKENENPAKPDFVNSLVVILVVVVIGVILAGVLYYARVYQRRGHAEEFPPENEAFIEQDITEVSEEFESIDVEGRAEVPIAQNRRTVAGVPGEMSADVKPVAIREDVPISQYMTTYTLGDDQFDDSFSIDSPAGEFLGECGVGISESIGVGDPKKATALEIWLFDKNDIQTVTKVLMSQYAFNDQELRQRLISKGELVLLEPGSEVVLETATLSLVARMVDLAYGSGPLPHKSYFERITLDLSIYRKR